jgi:flagella basal body P-ring formation protein FlgA
MQRAMLLLAPFMPLNVPAAAPETPRQAPAPVAALVEHFLRAQAKDEQGEASISVQPPRTAHLEACSQLRPMDGHGQALRSRMTVTVRCLAPSPWTIYVQANVSIMGSYYTAQRTIQAGEIITAGDLSRREGDLLKLSRDIVRDPEQAVGRHALQRLAAGTPIAARALRSPGSIERGKRVRILARGPGFEVAGEGLALESGVPGSVIQIRSSSGQIISGKVIDAHTALVGR